MKNHAFIELLVELDPENIAFLKFILEGYDGLASISTVANESGLVVLRCFPDLLNDLEAILSSIPFVKPADLNL